MVALLVGACCCPLGAQYNLPFCPGGRSDIFSGTSSCARGTVDIPILRVWYGWPWRKGSDPIVPTVAVVPLGHLGHRRVCNAAVLRVPPPTASTCSDAAMVPAGETSHTLLADSPTGALIAGPVEQAAGERSTLPGLRRCDEASLICRSGRSPRRVQAPRAHRHSGASALALPWPFCTSR